MTLVVDVGTNAEIVLGNKRRLLAASTRPDRPSRAPRSAPASGPRRAPSSASASTARRSSRGSGSSASMPGPTTGFRGAVAAAGTGVTGICGSGIIEVVAELFLAGVITADGVIDGALAERHAAGHPRRAHIQLRAPRARRRRPAGGPRIVITQNDVRAIQLAKAALYAGVRLLMDQLGRDTVDEVRLAGAFGSQIDPLHAMVLGLVPDCDLARVRAAGNAAGTGALIALLSGAARREIEAVVRRVEKIETAVEPRFQEHFVEAMAIPPPDGADDPPRAGRQLPARAPAAERRSIDRPLDRRRRRAALRPVPNAEDER